MKKIGLGIAILLFAIIISLCSSGMGLLVIEIGIVGFAPRCPFAGRSLRTTVGRISPSIVTVPAVTGTVRATTFASLLVWRPLARTVAALRSVAVAVITAFPAVTPRTGITAAAPVLLRTPVLSVVTGPLGGFVSLTPVIHLFNRPRSRYPRPLVFCKCLISRLSLLRAIRIFPMRTAVTVSEIFHYLSINAIRTTNVTHFSYIYTCHKICSS